jgi:hypothetical protein
MHIFGLFRFLLVRFPIRELSFFLFLLPLPGALRIERPHLAFLFGRYLGNEAARNLGEIDQPVTRMARIDLHPTWVGVLDFQTRLPAPRRHLVNEIRLQTVRITLRPAVPADAAAIGAVFDAAVRTGWTYLGELVAEPMFRPQDWDQLVADRTPPNVLLVAGDETEASSVTQPFIQLTVRCSFSSFIPPTPVAGLAELSSPPLTTHCASLVAGSVPLHARAERTSTSCLLLIRLTQQGPIGCG